MINSHPRKSDSEKNKRNILAKHYLMKHSRKINGALGEDWVNIDHSHLNYIMCSTTNQLFPSLTEGSLHRKLLLRYSFFEFFCSTAG